MLPDANTTAPHYAIDWQHYLIPCPFKKLTGYDCPGCGVQRAFIALLKGHFNESLHLYPGLLPLLLVAVYLLIKVYKPIDHNGLIKKLLYAGTSIIILSTYLVKLSTYIR